jgi:hypothetical protein
MRALWPINIRGQTEEARTIWSRENMAYTTSINDPAETLEKLIFAREQPHLFFFLLLLSQSFLLYRRVFVRRFRALERERLFGIRLTARGAQPILLVANFVPTEHTYLRESDAVRE